MRAKRENIDLTGTYAVVGEIVEDPKTLTVEKIAIEFHVKGNLDENLRKKFESFALKGCFVGNSLKAQKDFTFVYEE